MPRNPGNRESLAIVVSAIPRDAALTASLLERSGVPAAVCPDPVALADWIRAGIGALVIAEESLHTKTVSSVSSALREQARWSDLPVLVLTGSESAAAVPRARRLQGIENLGNVTLLERPLRVHELVTAVRAALRARGRQFEVRALLEETTNAVRSRDHFLAMLGHELRNPLAAINFALGLERHQNANAEPSRHRQTIDRQMRHLSRLVDDLLDVGRVTSGKIVLKTAVVELRALVRRVVQSLESVSGGHHVTFDAGRTPLFVEGDPVRLEQIFTNVVSNALKYTPAGGHVWVRVSRDGDVSTVSVRDDGMGIAPEMLPTVFDLFAQAQITLDRAKGGLGIGLTLVRSLVEMHKGQVFARSEGLGKGSEFVVRIPLSGPAEARPATSRATRTGRAPPRHVLVVEDNADIRDAIREILESAGHRVSVASDGRSAIAVAKKSAPQVALVDIGLPDIDGYDVARTLRREHRASMRLIALTGYGQPSDRREAEHAGFDRHLTKPVSAETLLEAIAADRTRRGSGRERTPPP